MCACNKRTLATRWFWLIINAKLLANWQTDKLTKWMRQTERYNKLTITFVCTVRGCVCWCVCATGILSACVWVCVCAACLLCCGIQPGGHTRVQANVLCGFIIAIEMKNKYFNYRANTHTQSSERNKRGGRGEKKECGGGGWGCPNRQHDKYKNSINMLKVNWYLHSLNSHYSPHYIIMLSPPHPALLLPCTGNHRANE